MAVWDNALPPLLGENQKTVVKWDSQETYEKMTLFRDPPPFAAQVVSGRATD